MKVFFTKEVLDKTSLFLENTCKRLLRIRAMQLELIMYNVPLYGSYVFLTGNIFFFIKNTNCFQASQK